MTVRFHYTAVNRHGQRVDGMMESHSKDTAIAELKAKGIFPIQLDPLSSGLWAKLNQPIEAFQRVKMQDLAFLMKQLAPLITARLMVERALVILRNSAERPVIVKLLDRILERLRSGSSLAQAMVKEKPGFPNYVIAMINAGEQSGHLGEALTSLSRMLDRMVKFQSSIIGALIYPAILMVVVTLTLILMIVFVLPQFSQVFGDNLDKLPWVTGAVMKFGNVMRHYWPLIAALVALLISSTIYIFINPVTRGRVDKFVIQSKSLRGWLIAPDIIRYARTLGVLLQSAQPLSEAMGLAQLVVKNKALQADLQATVTRVRKGERISKVFEELNYLPSIFLQLVVVGEETAALGQMINQSADVMEEQLEHRLQRFLAAFAPIMTLVLGGVVAFLIGALILGMMSVNAFI